MNLKKGNVLNLYQWLYLKLIEKRSTWKKEQCFPGKSKYQDKTFLVIRRSGMKLGLFSYFNTHLAKIDYAFQNNMVPVVDMQHFRNACQNEMEINFVNIWEKFFEQPGGYSLSEAYSAKKIVLSDAEIPEIAPNDSMDFFDDKDGKQTYWRRKCREYIKLQPHIQELFEMIYDNLFDKNDKIVGVLARGTDYIDLRPSNHPVQPTVEQLLEKTKEVMTSCGCNKIFLATEDKNIANQFYAEYGNLCVTNTREFVEYEGGYLSEIKFEKDNDRYNRDLSYLMNILILAKSSCIVAGRTSGTVGATLFSDGWEYSYFFDLGYYE